MHDTINTDNEHKTVNDDISDVTDDDLADGEDVSMRTDGLWISKPTERNLKDVFVMA